MRAHAVTDGTSWPPSWRLFLTESRDDICSETNENAALVAAKRTSAKIPDTISNRPEVELALEAIDELACCGPPAPVADGGYGEIGYFRTMPDRA